jgi:hypothetical protein
VCTNGVCGGTAITCPTGQICIPTTGICGACTVNSDCLNTNSCVQVACVSGACVPTQLANGTACNDNNGCTTNDVCTNGVCGGTAVVCTALDQCHVAGTCTNGSCSNPTKSDGTSCNDNSACTTNDVCTTGICGGTAIVCPVNNVCDPATGSCVLRSPDGDLVPPAGVDLADALFALRIAAGLETPTASELIHGQVAPIVNGISTPGTRSDINMGDVLLIFRKALGLENRF